MSGINCNCGDAKFPNTGKPNCVIEQKTMAMPVFRSKNKKDGTKNYIDTGIAPALIPDSNGVVGNYATLGDYIKGLIAKSKLGCKRKTLYPTQS